MKYLRMEGESSNSLSVKLYKDHRLISDCKLSLKDFAGSESVNKKCFYEIMSGKDSSCFLRAMIGIAPDSENKVDVTSLPLTFH